MACPDINRAEHKRNYSCYPSDCSDDEWAIIEPFLPAARHGGRPRTTDMRCLTGAILNMAQGGIQWRMLPRWAERAFAWMGRCRRMAKDYESSIEISTACTLIAHFRMLMRRLARYCYAA